MACAVLAMDVPYPGDPDMPKPVIVAKEGKTYEIEEPDMWKQLVGAARKVSEKELYEKSERAMRKAFRVKLDVPGCTKHRVRYFDPTYTAPEDVYIQGRLAVRKGTRFNPVEVYGSLAPTMLFGKLDDPMARSLFERGIKKRKFIYAVTDGDIYDLARKYYQKVAKASDLMLRRFNIRCVPSVVTVAEDGKRLKIEEWPEGVTPEVKKGEAENE